jgi:hypothetical protein
MEIKRNDLNRSLEWHVGDVIATKEHVAIVAEFFTCYVLIDLPEGFAYISPSTGGYKFDTLKDLEESFGDEWHKVNATLSVNSYGK